MLVLSRHENQRIFIDGGRIVLTVVELRGDKVRIGFEAAADVRIDREEIHREREAERKGADDGSVDP